MKCTYVGSNVSICAVGAYLKQTKMFAREMAHTRHQIMFYANAKLSSIFYINLLHHVVVATRPRSHHFDHNQHMLFVDFIDFVEISRHTSCTRVDMANF